VPLAICSWLTRLGVAIGSTALVFVASRDCGGLVGRGLIYRLLLGLGRRSYSIYLVHISAFFGTREILSRLSSTGIATIYTDVWTLLIGLGLVAFLGETTYRLVERRRWAMPAFLGFSKAAPLAPPYGSVIAVSETFEKT
jgi:peptidoglycan/LPS O-acetylase OafA/YrhL